MKEGRTAAVAMVAGIYGYFLIFAQFAWVELLRGAGRDASSERLALGAMAVAGVAGGFWMARRRGGLKVLRWALAAGAGVAAIAPWAAGSFPAMLAVSVASGGALGVVTVGVAAGLPKWATVDRVGLGTGLGYAVCNLPWVFLAEPRAQAWVGAVLALTAAAASFRVSEGDPVEKRYGSGTGPLTAAMVLVFLALVWLDSAAFFVIQHARELKEGTWGEGMLWRNAGLHLGAAWAAGLALRHSVAWRALPVAAWVALAVAGLGVNAVASREVAGWWYPVGVSLYSTALVAWPGFGPGRGRPEWRAAWVFAVAGWFGSANGIGMAQTLSRVPETFVWMAGLAVVGGTLAWRRRWPVGVGTALVALGAAAANREPAPETAVERGARVYLAEGCVTCHSRYVRENDPAGWGPPSELAAVRNERPVTIGNRRQGPDLANVGARRSEAWLREHFLDPRALVPDSVMPAYGHLFAEGDRRGEDLIAWLREGSGEAVGWRYWKAVDEGWNGKAETVMEAEAKELFALHCAACHGPEGRGDGPLAGKFLKPPANLREGPFAWTAGGLPELRRAIRWGLPGTDMPGHELLGDAEVDGLARWLMSWRGP